MTTRRPRQTYIPGQYTIDFSESENQTSAPYVIQNQEIDEDLRLSIEKEEQTLRYISFGSGSSGNSCYIGTRKGGIIIDAGVSPDIVKEILKKNGIKEKEIKAVLLTHDHSDHVKYSYKFVRAFQETRLFCTNRIITGILRKHSISRRLKDYHQPIFKEIPFKICDFEITAFEVPHDGSDNMGFNIKFHNRNFVLATDLGAITDRARHYMSQAEFLVIEANYDDAMLTVGPYPQYLKTRIRTQNGHMDNADTARFLTEIASGPLKYIFLCHLSLDNNSPQKALQTVGDALREAGYKVGDASESIQDRNSDLHLCVLPRFEATRLFSFRPTF